MSEKSSDREKFNQVLNPEEQSLNPKGPYK